MNTKLKLAGIAFVALLLLVMLTDPTKLPVPLLILPFVLLFVLLLLLIKIILERSGQRDAKSTKMAFLIASTPILLLAMQSVGQLTFRDILTILALFIIGYLYLHRMSRSPA